MNHLNASSLPTCNLPRSDWYRAVPIAFAHSPLGFAHTSRARTRFNVGRRAYPLLYFAPNPALALLEVQALVRSTHTPGGLIVVAPRAYVIFRVNFQLNCIVDFGDPTCRHVVSSTAQELTGDWSQYPHRSPPPPAAGSNVVRSHTHVAPTQDLGRALYGRRGIKGFLSPSAQKARYSNLIVFPDRVTIHDDCVANLHIESNENE